MLKCQSPLQEDLKAYLDSELSPVRHAAVAKHLLGCPACQKELVALRQLSAQLTETLPATEPLPDALRARILAALPEKSAPRPFSLAFWFRPGPMAALGGTMAMGCAFLLWLRVPESDKSGKTSPPAKALEQTKAPSDAPAVAAMATRVSTPKEEKQEPEPSPVPPATPAPPPTPAPLPAPLPPVSALVPLPSQQYAGELKSDNAKSINQPLSAPKPSGSFRSTSSPTKPRADVLTIPGPEVAKAEEEMGAKKKVALEQPPAAPVTDSPERKSQENSQQLRAMTNRRVALPTSYTLTIAAGKRTETLESIQKLAEELAVTVGEEQSDLSLRLAPERREVLLERLKALGALVETPLVAATDADNLIPRGVERSAATNSQLGGNQGGAGRGAGQAGTERAGTGQTGGGAGGGFGGFGGGMAPPSRFMGGRGGGAFGGVAPSKPAPAAKDMPPPLLRLTLVIKEAEPKKESERKELP